MAKCYRKLAGHWHVEGEGECEAELQAGWQAGRMLSPSHANKNPQRVGGGIMPPRRTNPQHDSWTGWRGELTH